ncbi:hypothetical protein GA0070216_108203 [Micromonospora matsumotoense]|uniref:Uncharacterized protein n=1 Tax=Micromonospora matsumotoense TaxID=121616 RepID=A0A1C4Z6D5_9ACTN|nr:hypothetical protein [Micromonospora matsumotoense]SCF28550.1 hypothetical protein GA0070216_108203 [Micromonospora matsumotoense]
MTGLTDLLRTRRSGEKLLGWLSVGRPDPRAARPEQPPVDVWGRRGVLGSAAAGSVVP